MSHFAVGNGGPCAGEPSRQAHFSDLALFPQPRTNLCNVPPPEGAQATLDTVTRGTSDTVFVIGVLAPRQYVPRSSVTFVIHAKVKTQKSSEACDPRPRGVSTGRSATCSYPKRPVKLHDKTSSTAFRQTSRLWEQPVVRDTGGPWSLQTQASGPPPSADCPHP